MKKEKNIKFIIDLICSFLVIILLAVMCIELILDTFSNVQEIYCNYAVENGDYEDNFTGRLNCTTDLINKFVEVDYERNNRK